MNKASAPLLLLLALGASCASVRREPGLDPRAVRRVETFSLSVRADDPALEAFLVQRARELFSPLLPPGGGPGRLVLRLSVREPRPAAALSLGVSSFGTPASGPISPAPPPFLPGGEEPRRRTWVDADLLVRVEDESGRALYAAAVSVRGRRHLVESPRRAAEVCLRRAARDLEAFLVPDGPYSVAP